MNMKRREFSKAAAGVALASTALLSPLAQAQAKKPVAGKDYGVLEQKSPVDAPAGGVAADSLAPKRVGSLMFPIAQRHIERTVLVTDDAIRDAQRALWKNLRIVAEPGGAAALAALISGAYEPRANQTIGVLLCGANTTAVSFA